MNKEKHAQKQTLHERNEHLTNWYMVNLGWGIAGILALTFIYKGYRSVQTILAMQPLMWILTGIFAVGAGVVFLLGYTGKIKNQLRARNYGILLVVCALVGLWLALYNRIRPVLETCARAILRRPELTVNSYWNVRIPMIAIGVYLVAGFIWLAVKLLKK